MGSPNNRKSKTAHVIRHGRLAFVLTKSAYSRNSRKYAFFWWRRRDLNYTPSIYFSRLYAIFEIHSTLCAILCAKEYTSISVNIMDDSSPPLYRDPFRQIGIQLHLYHAFQPPSVSLCKGNGHIGLLFHIFRFPK